MSASHTYKTDAVLNVAGVESIMHLQVHYIVLPEVAGTWDQPTEPCEIEILSVWQRGACALHPKMLTDAQRESLAEEICIRNDFWRQYEI